MESATANPSPAVRVWVTRTLSYRGKTEAFPSLSGLFQSLCLNLQSSGELPGVYSALARVKLRILNNGLPLSSSDIFEVAQAHNDRKTPDPIQVGAPRLVLSVPGAGDFLAYHREFVQNLQIAERPLLALHQDALLETLAATLHPRNYSPEDIANLSELSFPELEGLGTTRILDTIYKTTFSRTMKKDLCDRKIIFPVSGQIFRLAIDAQRVAHFTAPVLELFRYILSRLYRTPDLATVLDSDDRYRLRIQEGLRLLSSTLHDQSLLAQKRTEVEAILQRRQMESDETLEELPSDTG